MQTILVEIKNDAGLKILKDLEEAKILRLIKQDPPQIQKLSQRLRGSISKETTLEMHKEFDKMRNEWELRNI